MIGAIIGDIVGSRFEFNNIKSREFELLHPGCFFTDDSVMTVAVAKAILAAGGDCSMLGQETVLALRELGQRYPDSGYGGMFRKWLFSGNPMPPYGSYGNGAAMRVSPCGLAARTVEEARLLSRLVTEVTHNHPEGLKGAEAVAVCAFLARTGHGKEEIGEYARKNYYPLGFTLDSIRASYLYNGTCQETVPQALVAFLESVGFEDAIRGAVSIGGDSDTLAAITGGLAEAYYGIPQGIAKKALSYLPEPLSAVICQFYRVYPQPKGSPER
ncbi:MAG: ADP-ribosylglycohydrolase family protein [Deltaproteobacteria bacterium]|nr:ADP-ribosylglycohydrolase family protein [Deltaproteobacteria bacterium]